MNIYDNTRYELNLYTDETCTTFKAVVHRSVDKENMKNELKYLKDNNPEVLNRLRLVEIHTTFNTVDINKFLEEKNG